MHVMQQCCFFLLLRYRNIGHFAQSGNIAFTLEQLYIPRQLLMLSPE